MSQPRKAKLKKRAEREQRSTQRKSDLAENALRHAGLYEAFQKIPSALQPGLLGMVQQAPEIVLDSSAEHCEFARGLQRGFLEYVRRPSRNPDLAVTPLEMVSFLIPLRFCVEGLEKNIQAGQSVLPAAQNARFLEFAVQLRAFVQEHDQRIQHDFVGEVWALMLWNSQLDERILWSTFTNLADEHKYVVKVLLHRTKPERKKIVVDGQPRPAFRCCLPVGTLGLREVAWHARDFGFPDDPREYPVFMQSHVLEQTEKRAPCSKPIFPIVSSLTNPKFLRLSDDRFLVEYRHLTYKLGYFVAVRLADCVLLKTFLFLTMQGTPESDLLYRNLRLTRSDIEYMKLDELAAFRDPEVRNDPALVKLLNDCGCGHLLTLTAADMPKEIPTGYAETLRRYLGTLDETSDKFTS